MTDVAAVAPVAQQELLAVLPEDEPVETANVKVTVFNRSGSIRIEISEVRDLVKDEIINRTTAQVLLCQHPKPGARGSYNRTVLGFDFDKPYTNDTVQVIVSKLVEVDGVEQKQPLGAATIDLSIFEPEHSATSGWYKIYAARIVRVDPCCNRCTKLVNKPGIVKKLNLYSWYTLIMVVLAVMIFLTFRK